MNESYVEQLIKQKTTMPTRVKRAAISLLILLGLLLCWLSFAAIPLLLALIALTVWLWKRTSLEYEYLYYAGDIDIDKIMGRQKRKRVLSTDIKNMEVLAPTGSVELQRYQDLKVVDCSSNTGNPTYEMVVMMKGQKVRVKFEPKEEIVDGMRMYDPRKVFKK